MHETLKNEVNSVMSSNTNGPLIVALSGGVDSMVLFDVLHTLGFSLVVAHVNHNVREQSKEEQRFLQQWAAQKNVAFETTTLSFKATANFQMQAREARLEFFKQVAQHYSAHFIVMAHHLDDQIETFMMRLINGGSSQSLQGMRTITPCGNLSIIRPLLNTEKAQLLDYAAHNSVPYFEDVSNASSNYTRNRIRNDILPLFHSENPQYKYALLRHMNFIEDAQSLIDASVEAMPNLHDKAIAIGRYFDSLPSVRYALMKRALDHFNCLLGVHQFNTIEAQLSSQSNFKLPVCKRVTLHKEYNTFYFNEPRDIPFLDITIQHKGIYQIHKNLRAIISDEKINHKTSKYFELWYNGKVYPIQVRTRMQGDYLEFSYGHKKLKDLLIDKKIPPHLRDRLLVLSQGAKILWIPSLDVSSVTDGASHIIYVCLETIGQTDDDAMLAPAF